MYVTLEMIFGFMEGNQSFILECLLMKENYTFSDKDGRESEMGETTFWHFQVHLIVCCSFYVSTIK